MRCPALSCLSVDTIADCETALRGGRGSGRRGSTASHSKRTSFLPMAKLKFAIAHMTQGRMPACHAFLCLFWSHPIGTRHKLLGSRSREPGTEWRDDCLTGKERMNERTYPSESIGLERSSSSKGAAYMLSPPVPFFFVKSAGGKRNSSQLKVFCGN